MVIEDRASSRRQDRETQKEKLTSQIRFLLTEAYILVAVEKTRTEKEQRCSPPVRLKGIKANLWHCVITSCQIWWRIPLPTASTVNPTNNYVKKPKIKVLLKNFVTLLCSILYSKSTSAAVCECFCVFIAVLGREGAFWKQRHNQVSEY